MQRVADTAAPCGRDGEILSSALIRHMQHEDLGWQVGRKLLGEGEEGVIVSGEGKNPSRTL